MFFPQAGQTTTKNSDVESTSDSAKGLVSSPTPDADSSEPMEMDIKTEKDKDLDSSKEKEEKPSSPKSTSPDSLQSSHPSSSSSTDLKQEKDLKKMDVKEEKSENGGARKGSTNDTKIDVDLVKLKTKTEKMETCPAGKSSRPSSTPPSDTGMRKPTFKVPHLNFFRLSGILRRLMPMSFSFASEHQWLVNALFFDFVSKAEKEKVTSPGLKRTLSEGNENDEPATKRELKRAKVEREELEAELELKITAKAGSHHKLEKVWSPSCVYLHRTLSQSSLEFQITIRYRLVVSLNFFSFSDCAAACGQAAESLASDHF